MSGINLFTLQYRPSHRVARQCGVLCDGDLGDAEIGNSVGSLKDDLGDKVHAGEYRQSRLR